MNCSDPKVPVGANIRVKPVEGGETSDVDQEVIRMSYVEQQEIRSARHRCQPDALGRRQRTWDNVSGGYVNYDNRLTSNNTVMK